MTTPGNLYYKKSTLTNTGGTAVLTPAKLQMIFNKQRKNRLSINTEMPKNDRLKIVDLEPAKIQKRMIKKKPRSNQSLKSLEISNITHN